MTEQRNILGTIGPRVNVEILISKLITSDGTFAHTGQAYRGNGIIVALPGGAVYDVSHLDAGQRHLLTRLWVEDVAALVTDYPAPFYRPRYFGSWVDSDTGTLYLDVVEVFSRDDIGEAIEAGRNRNQIAIWDAGRSELIETGGTGAVE